MNRALQRTAYGVVGEAALPEWSKRGTISGFGGYSGDPRHVGRRPQLPHSLHRPQKAPQKAAKARKVAAEVDVVRYRFQSARDAFDRYVAAGAVLLVDGAIVRTAKERADGRMDPHNPQDVVGTKPTLNIRGRRSVVRIYNRGVPTSLNALCCAWRLHTGEWPTGQRWQVEAIDGDDRNLAFGNLQSVSRGAA